MLEDILFKIIHFSLVISVAAMCSISYPAAGSAESLWKNATKSSSCMLFTDTKAAHVGDIVTVIISEKKKTEFNSEAEHKKKSSVIGSITSLLFPAAAEPDSTDTLNANKPYTGSRAGMHNGKLPASKWSGDQSFTGDGNVKNDTTVEARISCRVIAELPNDCLMVEGKRAVKVGEEEDTVILSGIVRKEDIRSDNSVESQYLSDAKINIQGKGPVTASQKKGVLTKVWEFLGLY